VKADAPVLKAVVGKQDQLRLDEHLASIRDVERSITSLPPEYHRMDPPQSEGDLRDWPRIAKLQSDLLANALASGQSRVASYMLTKCQGLARFPWLGLTTARHHDYTHVAGNVPGGSTPAGQRILRDICRWHVEEFAYLVVPMYREASVTVVLRQIGVTTLEKPVEFLETPAQRMKADVFATEMPLTDGSGGVSDGAHAVGKSCFRQRQPLLFWIAAYIQEVRSPVRIEFVAKAFLVTAGHETGSRGAAIRGRNVRLGEADAVFRQGIDVGSGNVLASINTEIVIA
jgi:hypothetical protein